MMNVEKTLKAPFILLAFLTLGLCSLNACRDEDPEFTTIDDILDVSVATDYSSAITSATSLDALPEEVDAAATVAEEVISTESIETFSSVDLTNVVADLEAQITLSKEETSLLLKNDAATYKTVVSRFATLPGFTSGTEMNQIASNMAGSEEWSDFRIEVSGSAEYLYADDYYKAVVTMQKFISQTTIPTLEQIEVLKTSGDKAAYINQQTAALTDAQKRQIATMVCISIHHFQQFVQAFLNSLPDHDGGASN
ncbi:hypothetical protein [Mangrovibacterium diazotrophicum]|uniref:DUF4358 domain-containing protein n=1 Tax=Mangrovibacterium diazotrophicum TaxID=1261403 RepID=A0A419W972_9BACT|nr:hypothetical protein [Mangrovibacterium diazotrophicum]RKD91990.1 hypothetical protein BC643_2359 [Mangrovibacterium diazotrophicum]